MTIDLNREAVQLCIAGTRAEFAGRLDKAYALYWKAWEISSDDYEACIAAHYVARSQKKPEAVLYWNQEALKHADAVKDESIRAFYPSLYLNMGHAHELLGHIEEANRFYNLAAELGFTHQPTANDQARDQLS